MLQALRQLGLNSLKSFFVGAFPTAGTYFMLQALRQLGLKLLKSFSAWRVPNSGNVLYATSTTPTKRKPIFYYSIIA